MKQTQIYLQNFQQIVLTLTYRQMAGKKINKIIINNGIHFINF